MWENQSHCSELCEFITWNKELEKITEKKSEQMKIISLTKNAAVSILIK